MRGIARLPVAVERFVARHAKGERGARLQSRRALGTRSLLRSRSERGFRPDCVSTISSSRPFVITTWLLFGSKTTLGDSPQTVFPTMTMMTASRTGFRFPGNIPWDISDFVLKSKEKGEGLFSLNNACPLSGGDGHRYAIAR
jgi:hypothetical protein